MRGSALASTPTHRLRSPQARLFLGVSLLAILASCDLLDETRIVGPEPPPRPACIPAPSGVVSWWPGDASNRDVVGTNPLELSNGATFGPGVVNEGFAFDGIDDYAGGEAEGIDRLQEFSIEAWVRVDRMTGTPHLMGLGPKAALHLFQPESQTITRFWVQVDGEYLDAFAPNVLTQGVFSHVAATYHPEGGVRLYVDGELVATGAAADGTVASTDHVGLSGAQAGVEGIVDEATVYDRDLTPEEIRAIAEAGSGGKCIPPAG